MYKIIAQNTKTGEEKQLEFDSAEDAKIYKQYHLRFGHWAEGTYWLPESKITEEQRSFIVDEITELENGEIKRKYQLSVTWNIKEEVATDKELLGTWVVVRRERNRLLADTDWTQLSDVSMSTADRGEWKKYRQYLRDYPKLHTDLTITGAKIASFREWKNGVR